MLSLIDSLGGREGDGRRLRVAHSSTGFARGLNPDENVVGRDAGGGSAVLGRVVGIDFELDDTYYEIQIDGDLTASDAVRYEADGTVGTHTVAVLLAELAGHSGTTAPPILALSSVHSSR